ncbi:hypothetical protein LINPERPRIM_LOCUS20619 [Linum perenne]
MRDNQGEGLKLENVDFEPDVNRTRNLLIGSSRRENQEKASNMKKMLMWQLQNRVSLLMYL